MFAVAAVGGTELAHLLAELGCLGATQYWRRLFRSMTQARTLGAAGARAGGLCDTRGAPRPAERKQEGAHRRACCERLLRWSLSLRCRLRLRLVRKGIDRDRVRVWRLADCKVRERQAVRSAAALSTLRAGSEWWRKMRSLGGARRRAGARERRQGGRADGAEAKDGKDGDKVAGDEAEKEEENGKDDESGEGGDGGEGGGHAQHSQPGRVANGGPFESRSSTRSLSCSRSVSLTGRTSFLL